MRLGSVKTGVTNFFRRLIFDNRKFWDQRYKTDPVRGSGPGSRRENLKLKRNLIQAAIDRHNIGSLLDIGCGDIAILEEIEIGSYTGVDISEVVIKTNRSLRPGWTFVCADLTKNYAPPAADLVLCFDVLIHQPRKSNYRLILNKALSSAKKIALISGFSGPFDGVNVFFHEPIMDSIRDELPDAKITKIAEYRNTDVIEVIIP